MKKIKTEDAVGSILCHDMTQIIPGVKKDAVFRKGHVVTEEDIPVLLSIGKEHLYVWEKQEGMLHENEAAQILYEICENEHMSPTEVKEGKIELIAEVRGLLKIDKELLNEINAIEDLMIATRHGDFTVEKGDKVAGTRVIPLVIDKARMDKAREAASGRRLMYIKPFLRKKVGIVTTGNEVYSGLIKDAFGPVIKNKLAGFDTEVLGQVILGDDPAKITRAILDFIEKGADLVICTGGMSVDPDDTTPSAIINTGAEIISYGAPVLPGAMLLVSYYNEVPIVGLPGCVMYGKRTVFDLILPRIMADEKITKEELAKLGHGGLCLNCELCNFPVCGFGKA